MYYVLLSAERASEIYIYIEREREREMGGGGGAAIKPATRISTSYSRNFSHSSQ